MYKKTLDKGEKKGNTGIEKKTRTEEKSVHAKEVTLISKT